MGYRMLAGLGRFLMSIIFIILGAAGAMNWDIAKGDLTNALGNWELYAGHWEGIGGLFQYLSSAVPLLVGLGIFLQIAGGILVCLSMKVRLGATLLFFQLLFSTVIYHYFWFLDGLAMAKALVLFMKNVSILGGLLLIIAMGPFAYHEASAPKK